jgi:TIR domain
MKDVFLSHAAADKEGFVRPLARELDALGVSYWLDEAEIGWGERIAERINDGLKQSRFVVAFISETFVGRRWTETELFSALFRETSYGITVVLPIVVGDPRRVLASYPLLADKIYCHWEAGPSAIASRLKTELAREQSTVDRSTCAALRRYYSLVSDRNPEAAFSCLSRDFRRDLSLDQYVQVFGKTASAEVSEYELLTYRHDYACARATVLALGISGERERWRGAVEFVSEDGEWRILTMKGLRRLT